MKHIIIGTAGHIDHGKTTLIRALTGKDTDTLKEEKKRGISINLGFTFFDLPSGKRAGIIDVPGHEKFIKNMLAGATSIDVVLLVIAADEGIMPQTREHLEILQLLRVKKGIIVLTKCDTVDLEWLELMKEEIREDVKNTFMEKADILCVSSKTGEGIDSLVEKIDNCTEDIESRDTEGHFRLPIDRVFSVSGFGTVVTGTIISGRVMEGDVVELYPSGIASKVRGIQVHEQSVSFAEAGQRCAINLSNVKVEDIERGNVLSSENIMAPSLMIDCKIDYLKSCEKPLVNRQRIRIYHGTSEILGRVVLLDKEELEPGESAYVQVRLENTITAQKNDRFVIRSYSPMDTIGGGFIIEPCPKKAKRFDKEYISEIKVKEKGSISDVMDNVIKNISSDYPDENMILKNLGKNIDNLSDKLSELEKEKKIISLKNGEKNIFIHSSFLQTKSEMLQQILSEFHMKNPLKIGVSKEEVKNKVFGKALKQKNYDEILGLLKEKKQINIYNNLISMQGFSVKYNKEQQQYKEDILKAYIDGRYITPRYDDIAQNVKDKKIFKMVFDSLIDYGLIIKLSDECIFERENYEKAKVEVVEYIKKNGSITPAQYRDLLNTSRKYTVALLEHFDSIKLTKRQDDDRVLF